MPEIDMAYLRNLRIFAMWRFAATDPFTRRALLRLPLVEERFEPPDRACADRRRPALLRTLEDIFFLPEERLRPPSSPRAFRINCDVAGVLWAVP